MTQYDIYYDDVVGFVILDIEQEYKYKYVKDLERDIRDEYRLITVDYDTLNKNGVVGFIDIPEDDLSKPVNIALDR